MLNWQWKNFEGIEYMTIPQWEEQGVQILFTGRHAGNSIHPYSSLNMALHVGDEDKNVLENRKHVMKIFSSKINDIVCCEQVHGSDVAVVDKTHQGRGALEYSSALAGFDAMITNKPGLFLSLFFADCFPVFLFDPVKKAIAMVHSGWKGTIKKIVINAVESMKREYKVNPVDIQGFIGPGILRCCFEISDQLAESVNQEFPEFDEILSNNNGQYSWDLARTNYNLLLSAGLPGENILVSDLCTKCHNDKFFSYRAEAGKTGRMAAIIGLK